VIRLIESDFQATGCHRGSFNLQSDVDRKCRPGLDWETCDIAPVWRREPGLRWPVFFHKVCGRPRHLLVGPVCPVASRAIQECSVSFVRRRLALNGRAPAMFTASVEPPENRATPGERPAWSGDGQTTVSRGKCRLNRRGFSSIEILGGRSRRIVSGSGPRPLPAAISSPHRARNPERGSPRTRRVQGGEAG